MKRLEHRALADAGLATEKNHLAHPGGSLEERGPQAREFGLAADRRAQLSRRLDRRLRGVREIVRIAAALHLGDESITAARDGFDELWRFRIVTQRRTHFAQVETQYAFANEGRGPDGFAQFLVGDEPARMLDHVAEKREGLGAQRDHLGAAQKPLVARIELIGRKSR